MLLRIPTALALLSITVAASASLRCRAFPGESDWPTTEQWMRLNETVKGRLVATVPLGSPCHDPTYDEEQCDSLKMQWLDSGIHMVSSSSVMAPVFANQSCDPFQPRDRPCEFGNYVRYAVNATGAQDISAAIKFAKEKNVRLVIRNTGHDYLGRSTGAGSLAIWTHYLKLIEPLDWADASYRGKALRLGAGVQGFEAVAAASKLELVVVTGECPTVGVAGGYTQGGGHSGLSTSFGLAADNALSYEVVTADGKVVTASSTENDDLYWALSGGGAGTFGVVLSITVKAHPDTMVSGASFALTAADNANLSTGTYQLSSYANDSSALSIYRAIDVFHGILPDLVDFGTMVIYFFGSTFLQIPALTAYGKTKAELQEALLPLTRELQSMGLRYTLTLTEYYSYREHYDHYWGPLPLGNIQVGTAQYGGRLIGRSQLGGFSSAARQIVEEGVVFIGVGTDVARFGVNNAVLPAWRDAIVAATLSLPWNFTAPWEEGIATQKKMTEVVQPIIEAATPGGGVYMNEADWRQPDWQQAFFGSNYQKLLEIKGKWDPHGLFYVTAGVGSERYEVQKGGRLCDVEGVDEL